MVVARKSTTPPANELRRVASGRIKKKSSILVSVVFSFRNEEGNLDELIRRVQAALDSAKVEHELIFVNDSSTDRSIEILTRHAARDRRIKVLNMSRRWGPSPCALAGMAHSSGDAVIYMDSDLQDPPELIPKMIKEFRNGADVVNTTRTERLGESHFKMWVTKQAYRIINLLADTDIPMNTGDFKLLSRRTVEEVVRIQEYNPFLRGLVRWVGFKQVQIYYRREARGSGKTHVPLYGPGPLRAFVSGITSFSNIPLYLSFVLGIFVSFGSFAYLTYIVISRVFFGLHNPGWPAVMVTMLFLCGVILATIGILSIYVASIHRQVKNRPLYIVESGINLPGIPGQAQRSFEEHERERR
jgi:dolichol-phosphate mannosyltransferase